jgi:hypothetical protein
MRLRLGFRLGPLWISLPLGGRGRARVSYTLRARRRRRRRW